MLVSRLLHVLWYWTGQNLAMKIVLETRGLYIYIFQIDSYNKSTSHLFEATLSTVVCYVAVIAQLFRLSTHPKATELRVTALAPLDRHLRRLARADVALLPAGVQHGGGKGARCTAAWLLP